jgi:pimeloyl-ACP methyl ester carboxylesterase
VGALRPIFRTLERVAPGAAVSLATRIWFTPPRRRARSAGPRPAGARQITVPVNGRPIVVDIWADGGCGQPTVYLVHGWGGWRAQLDPFVAPLLAAGYRVVSYDALNHGDSPRGRYGRMTNLPEMWGALAAVIAAVGPAHGVIAHSLGATSTALGALDGLAVGRLVLIAPPADPPAYTRQFARTLGFSGRIGDGVNGRVERLVNRPITDFDIPARLRAASGLPPLLLIHDRDDKEAAYADAPRIAAGWPGTELVTTEGLGHRRILRDPAVIERAVAHVRGGS